jgi:hypothetical protein
MGTDSGVGPHGRNLDELSLMVGYSSSGVGDSPALATIRGRIFLPCSHGGEALRCLPWCGPTVP